MKIFFPSLALVAALLLSGLPACSKNNQPEQPKVIPESTDVAEVFLARKIITMDENMPAARAVLVVNGEIVALSQDVDEFLDHPVYPQVLVNRTYENDVLMPGFIDPHLHPLMAAAILPMAFITPENWRLPRGEFPGAQTPKAYRTRLRDAFGEFDSSDNAKSPFFSWGWHPLWHGELNREWLSQLAPTRPVFIWHRSFHEIVTNDAGMALLGYGDQVEFDSALVKAGANPEHANYDDGSFAETALTIALPTLARYLLAPSHMNQGFDDLLAMMRRSGVTTIADMATGSFVNFDAEALIMSGVFEREDVPARLMLVPFATNMVKRTGSLANAIESMRQREENWPYEKLLLNQRFKLFSDGAFFSQYMQMKPPGYTDGHEGKWLTEPQELKAQAQLLWSEGYSLHVHVNGDRGVDVVLELLKDLRGSSDTVEQRFTLEHFGYSSPEQTVAIADLGALVSAQPNYLYVLSDKFAEHGLGEERAYAMSRLGSLERANVQVALHSDLTMAPVDPLFLAWVASNRIDHKGEQRRADERMSIAAALRAITIDAAYVLGLENEIGSISVGKRADFTALDSDPFETGAAGLRAIKVQGVVFDGKTYLASP